jgi:hypothetical protein
MLSDYFRIVQGIPSKSASSSDIFIVKDLKDHKEYFFKMFIDHYTLNIKTTNKIKSGKMLSADTQQLIREIRFYKTLREQVIIPHNSRNFLCIQGDGFFNTTEYIDLVLKSTQLSYNQVSQNVIQNTLYMLSQSENREAIDTKRPEISFVENNYSMSEKSWIDFSQPIFYRFMMTPKIQNMYLEKGLAQELNKGLNAKGFMNYIFILFLNQYIMSCYGMNQNDLHWANILMDDTYFGPSSLHCRQYLLVYDQEVLLIQNRYILYMYDFDRSVKQGEYFSALNDPNLISGGNCPEYHPKRDFIRTLCMVYRFIRDQNKSKISDFSDIQNDILNLFISNSYVRELIKQDHHMDQNSCLLQDFDNISLSCKPNLLKDVASNTSILDWSLTKTNYKRFKISELLDVEKNMKESPHYSNIKSILQTFYKQLSNSNKEAIYANIQFFNPSNIDYWTINNRKTSFVNLIYNIIQS